MIGLGIVLWRFGKFIYRFAVISAQRSIATAWRRTRHDRLMTAAIAAHDLYVLIAYSTRLMVRMLSAMAMTVVFMAFTIVSKFKPESFTSPSRITQSAYFTYAIGTMGIVYLGLTVVSIVNLFMFCGLVVKMRVRILRRTHRFTRHSDLLSWRSATK
jgi:hypothetical protein